MGVSFCAVNAGKKSITLNLKDAEGKAILKQLVKDADVVMENFLPGTMKSLGLNYDVLKEISPGLIYWSKHNSSWNKWIQSYYFFDHDNDGEVLFLNMVVPRITGRTLNIVAK